MISAKSSFQRGRTLITALLLAHLLAIAAMSASPALHHWIHHDADDDDHQCAVTLFLSGGSSAPPPVVAWVPVAFHVVEVPRLELLYVQWIASIFESTRVFEHAPPVWHRITL